MHRSESHINRHTMQRGNPQDLVKTIIDDAKARYHKPTRASQHKAMIFKMIRGGNVEIVKTALNILKDDKRINEYNWILGLDSPPMSFACYPECNNILIKALRYFVLISVAFLFFIITPFFYIIHSAINKVIMASSRRNLMDKIDLPLIYAVLSGNGDMVELFTSLGVKLTSCDKRGNNIFHYLADLSRKQPDKAISCFDIVSGLVQPSVIKYAIFEAQNDQGMSSFELLVAWGSFTYLTHMTEVEGIMKRTVLDVGPNHIHTSSSSEIGDHEVESSSADARLGRYTLCTYDVSMYEQGDALCKQSSILTRISNRNFNKVPQEEVECLFQCRWINKWCEIKIISATSKTYLCTLFLLLTFILYVLFVSQNSTQVTPLPLRSRYLNHMHNHFIERLRSGIYKQIESEVLLDYERSIDTAFTGSPTTNELKLAYEAFQVLCGGGNLTEVSDGVWLDPCEYEAFTKIGQSCPKLNKNPEELLIKTGFTERSGGARNIAIPAFLDVCLLLQVLGDVLLRLFFVYQQRSSFQYGIKRGIIALFNNRLPCSYFQAQLTILNALFINAFIYLELVYTPVGHAKLNYGPLIRVYNLKSYLLIGSMVTTTMEIIYSARHAPIVGLFIRTSIKLMSHVLEFVITYTCVASAFSTIFYFLLHNPECAAERMEGYESILETFYKTYLATVGQGDFPATFNTPVCITFAAYSLVSIIMLLNLIIAVMSTTADTIMNPPWRDVLKLNQKLTWALHMEVLGYMVWRPFLKIFGPCCALSPKPSDNAMVIRMEKGRRKVYIEVETDF